MKLETIKAHASMLATQDWQRVSALIEGAPVDVRSVETAIGHCLREMDARNVGRLREIYPRAFPTSLRSGPLEVSLDERGDWVVTRG